MSLKKALLKNGFSSLWSKFSMLIFRFVEVPFFVMILGLEDYGRWILLYSLPSWIALANLGFGSVAANKIAISYASGDLKSAREIFSSTLFLLTIIFLCGLILFPVIVWFVDWNVIFKSEIDRNYDFKISIIFLSLSVLVSFFGEVYTGIMRAKGKVHISFLINSLKSWLQLLILGVVSLFSVQFKYLSFGVFISSFIFLLVIILISYKFNNDIKFNYKLIKKSNFKELFTKGLAFQAFPLGNALLFQGGLYVVQLVLGPASVVLFATMRTLVRSINQLMEMINQSIWPELNVLFGKKDYPNIKRLHRYSVSASVLVSLFALVFLAVFGTDLYSFWIGKKIIVSLGLFLCFLIPIPFNSLWFTSSVVIAASNKHEGLAIRYLIATTVSLIACYLLSLYIGIEGAAISTVIGDLVLIPYVFKQSLVLSNDTFSGFYLDLKSDVRNIFRALKKRFLDK